MAHKRLSAIALQRLKCDAEVKIIEILQNLNAKCVENEFQLEELRVVANGTDELRSFDVDILIL